MKIKYLKALESDQKWAKSEGYEEIPFDIDFYVLQSGKTKINTLNRKIRVSRVCTKSNKQSKIVAHKEDKSQSIERDPQMTWVMKYLTVLKAAAVNIFK